MLLEVSFRGLGQDSDPSEYPAPTGAVAASSLPGRPATAAGVLPWARGCQARGLPRIASGDPLHDPYGGLDAKSRPQGTVFGGAAPLAKPVKLI